MRILFVYTEINVKFGMYGFQHGIAAISAYLKLHGYKQIQLCYLSPNYNPAIFRRIVESFKPDIVGFYTTHDQFRFIKRLLLEICDYSIFTICGGPHVTLNPEISYEVPRLDAVCIGEGEEPLLETVRDIEQNKKPASIRNLWIRRGKEIIKNPCRPFIENLDLLPFVDRDIFSDTKSYRCVGLTEISYKNSFRISRGCPYQCSFCSNRNIGIAQPGKFLRFRSVDNVIEELTKVSKKYRPSVIYFEDDTFTINENFINEFCEKFPEDVKLPFEFFSHISPAVIPVLRKLRRVGGRRVSFGIETGNEELRRKILRKDFSNKVIIEVFREAKQMGYQTEAFFMIGLPDETPELFQNTIQLARKIQPDLYSLSIYFPFPGTDLYQYSIRKGYIKSNFIIPKNFISRRDSLLNMPKFPRNKILKAVREFGSTVYRGYSLKKAIFFRIYESRFGEGILRVLSFNKRVFRRLAFYPLVTTRRLES